MRELTKEEAEIVDRVWNEWVNRQRIPLVDLPVNTARAILDYVESKRCVWTRTEDEEKCYEWRAECGGNGAWYHYDKDKLEFKFCPDCGARIEVKEEEQQQ